MSLIDKQLKAAKLQKELAIKRDDLAYKSFNGTRQTVRHFREGTLNIGQMGFNNTGEERITKEMITDYHKKDQDRTEERDLMQTDEDLVAVVNEIGMHKEVLQKAPAEIDNQKSPN
jgi:hypothetical protein